MREFQGFLSHHEGARMRNLVHAVFRKFAYNRLTTIRIKQIRDSSCVLSQRSNHDDSLIISFIRAQVESRASAVTEPAGSLSLNIDFNEASIMRFTSTA